MNAICSVTVYVRILVLNLILFSLLARSDNNNEQIAENISFVLQSDKTSFYVNQPVSLTLLIRARNLKVVSIYQLDSIFANPAVKMMSPFKELQPEFKYDLSNFEEIRRYRCEIVITSSGTITFSPSLKMDVLYRVEQSQIIRHKETDEKQITLHVRAQPVVLTVIPLPEADKPPDFCRAVGNFTFSIHIPSHVITVDERLKIRFIISGKGFIPEDCLPRISQLSGFIVKDPLRIEAYSPSEVVFEQTLIPQRIGQFLLPSVRFTFFNPETAKYKTIYTDNVTLNVKSVMDMSSNKTDVSPVTTTSQIKEGFSWLVTAIGITIIGGVILLYYMIFRPGNRLPLAIALTIIVISQGYVLIRAALVPGVIRKANEVTCRNEYARIAPFYSAIITFEIPSDTEVTVLEMAGDWVKIQWHGKRGWISISALQKRTTNNSL